MFAELNCLKSSKWFLTDYRIKLTSISSDLLPTTSQHTKPLADSWLCYVFSASMFLHMKLPLFSSNSHNFLLKWYLLLKVFPDLWRIKCFFLSSLALSFCVCQSYLSYSTWYQCNNSFYVCLFHLASELLESRGYVLLHFYSLISGTL